MAAGRAVFLGGAVLVGHGVFVGCGVFVGHGVFVGRGVSVGRGVLVGRGVSVGCLVFAGRGVSLGCGVLLGAGVGLECSTISAAITRDDVVVLVGGNGVLVGWLSLRDSAKFDREGSTNSRLLFTGDRSDPFPAAEFSPVPRISELLLPALDEADSKTMIESLANEPPPVGVEKFIIPVPARTAIAPAMMISTSGRNLCSSSDVGGLSAAEETESGCPQ